MLSLFDRFYLAARRLEYGVASFCRTSSERKYSTDEVSSADDDFDFDNNEEAEENKRQTIPFLTTTTTAKTTPPSSPRRRRGGGGWLFLVLLVFFLLLYVFLTTVFGWPVLDKRLPALPPLPKSPKRAVAVLHSESNPCYDMMLLTFVQSWLSVNSSYPLLILRSAPLPPRVAQLLVSLQEKEEHADNNNNNHHQKIVSRQIPAVINHFVVSDRVRSASTKLAVWAQDDFDQLAYYDSDTIFVENSDDFFTAPEDGGHGWLYAEPYKKYCDNRNILNSVRGKCVFQSNNFLIRPSKAVYHKIQDLFRRKFWIMNFHQFLKTADQGFLNAVFEGHWQQLDSTKYGRAKHIKFWKALEMEDGWGLLTKDQAKAQELYEQLNLEQDLEACKAHKRLS